LPLRRSPSRLCKSCKSCKSRKSEESRFGQLTKKSLNKEIARRGGCSRPLPLRRSPSRLCKSCKSRKSEESRFGQLTKKSLNKEIVRRGGCSRPLPLGRSPSRFSPLLNFLLAFSTLNFQFSIEKGRSPSWLFLWVTSSHRERLLTRYTIR
jgi:hypothetical protein